MQEIFLKIMREEEDVSAGVAAIRTLLTVIENYKGMSSKPHIKCRKLPAEVIFVHISR